MFDIDTSLILSYFVIMKKQQRTTGATGQLNASIGLRCPRETKLAVERMAKLLDRSENSVILDCIETVDQMSRAMTDKEASRMPKIVYMLRQATSYLAVNG